MVRQSGIIEESYERAKAFGDAAQLALSGLPQTPERSALAEIADYVLERKM